MKSLMKVIGLTSLLLFLACDNAGPEQAGNTTEIENAIAIRIFENDKPASKVAYKVLPSWFVPDTANADTETEYTYNGTTDSLGWMRIENHLGGSFTVQFEKENYSIVTSYTLDNLTPFVTLDSIALAKPGSIKGWVSLPKKAKYAWIFVQGIDRAEKTDPDGSFTISGLPSGNVKIKAWAPESQEVVGEASITVPQNDTADLGHIDVSEEVTVKKSMRINPRSLISSWMRPLSEPFVLTLRLDSAFNFSETNADGSDLHLYNSKGEPIPFEIDAWDTRIQSGALNIRLDNLSDTSSLWTLEWGDKNKADYEQVNVWKGLDDSLLWALSTVKIFDFEDSNLYMNNLPEPLPKREWYIQGKEGGVVYDSVDIDVKRAVVASTEGGAFGNNVMHVTYEANFPEYVVIGTRITTDPHDLSRLDSVEAWIKGDGNFDIILETIIESDTNYKATYQGEASSNWTRVVVRPQDFKTTGIKKYHGWDVTRTRITRFTIFAYDGKELWVDNVRLYGINRDDLN